MTFEEMTGQSTPTDTATPGVSPSPKKMSFEEMAGNQQQATPAETPTAQPVTHSGTPAMDQALGAAGQIYKFMSLSNPMLWPGYAIGQTAAARATMANAAQRAIGFVKPFVQGISTAAVTRPGGMPGGGAVQPMPGETFATTRARQKEVLTKDPFFAATQQAPEVAKNLFPIPPGLEDKWYTQLGGAAGGFAPVLASGPFAPFTIGMETIGDKAEKRYDENIKAGMSEEDAVRDAYTRAVSAGAAQSVAWQVAPKPIHSAIDKLIVDRLAPKIASTAAKRFLLDRAANVAEGATLGVATQIPTNIAAGDPWSQDVAQTAGGLAVAQSVFPRGATSLEHTREQAGRQEILNKVNSFLARNAPSEGEIQGPPIPKPYTEKYAPRPGEETGAPVDQATGKPLPMILDADLPTDLKQQVKAGKIIEFTDDSGQTTYYDAKGVTDASSKPSTTGVPSTQVRPSVDEEAPLRQPGETPAARSPGEESKPGTEAVASEPQKATPQQIEGWKTRRDEAQHEIDLLQKGEQTPVIKGHIEDKQIEIEHLSQQIDGKLPPDALPPMPKSSEGVAEGRIQTMFAGDEKAQAEHEAAMKEAEGEKGKLPGLSVAEERRLAELQQKKIRFDNASGPNLNAREWEEYVNLKAKQPDAISAAMGMPSVTDMLDEAKYGKLTPEQKNNLTDLRRSLKVGDITREQYDSEINKIVSDRPLPPGDIEGEFKKLRTLEDVDKDIAALNAQGKLSTPALVAERRQLLDQQDNQPPQPKVEPPPPEQKTPEEQSRDEAAAARVDPPKKIEGYTGPPDPNLPRPKVPVPSETPEHAKQVEQLRFRADSLQNQLAKRRGLPLNNEDANKTADLRDLWRQIHKIRRESGVRRKVGIVGWGAFGLTVGDHMPYEGPDVVIIGKGRIGGPASTSQEILNVGAGGGRGIKGRDLFGSKEATARNLGAEFVRGDVVDIKYANGKDGKDGLDIYLGERGADGKVTSINEVIPVWRIAMAPGARQQMMLEGPHGYPFLKDAGWGDAANLARASEGGKTVMTYGAGNAATQGIIGAIDQVGVPGAKKVFVVSRGPFKGEASDNQIRRLNDFERNGQVEYVQGPITDAVKQPDGKWIVDIHTKDGTKKFEVDHIENFLASTYNTDWLPPEMEVIPFESPVKDPRTGKQLIDPDTKEPVFQNVPLPLKPGLIKVLNAARQSTMEGVYVGGDARAGIDPHEEPPRRIDRATGDGANVAASIHTDLAYLEKYGRMREWNPAIKERVAETDQRIKELLGHHPDEPAPVIGPKTTTTRPSGPTETQPTKNLPGSGSATPSQTETSTTTSPAKTHDELYAEKNAAFKELRAVKDLPEHDPRVVEASDKYEKAKDAYRASVKPEAPPKQVSHEARGEIESAVRTKAQILADEQAAARKKKIRYGEAGTTLFQPTTTQQDQQQRRGFTGVIGPPRPAAEGAPSAPSRAPLLEKPKEPAVTPPSTKTFGPLADKYTQTGQTEAVIAKDLFDRTNPDREANIAQEFGMNTVTPRQADVAAKQIYDFSQKNLRDVRKLPEQVTVYRAGPISDDVVGVTLDKMVAQRNMDRHGDPVTEYTVPRKEVLADLQAIRPDGFQENELLVHPEHLRKAAVQPMMEQTERARRAADSVANARMAENPLYSDQLISDLATDKKTAMDGADEQVMVKTRAKFNTARDVAGRKALDKSATKEERAAAATNFEQLDNHIRQMDVATDNGDRFRNKAENLAWHSFRQKDYEFPAMEQRLTIAKHGAPLTPQETAKLHHDTNALSNAMVDVENAKRRTGWHPGLGANVAPGLRHLQYVAKQAKDKLDNQVFAANFKSSGALHKTGRVAREITSIPRAIMASMDLSAVRRQGGLFFMSHPLRSIAAMPDMLRAAKSDEAYFKLMQDIRERPNADLYRSSKLGLTDIKSPKLSDLEEQYMSQWADKIPLVNNSQRAYVYFLNRLRADTFDAMAATLGKHGIVTEKQAEGLSNFINVFTGRGNVGSHGQALALLNQLFFAPRYTLSRFQALTLQPLIHAKDPRVRLMIAQEYARSLIGFGIMYGLVSTTLKQFGVKVEYDPRSSDFGKIRIGDTRIDPMSGLSQTVVFMTRLITGQTKTAGGKITPLSGPNQPFSERNISNVLFDFGRSKLAPIPSALLNARIGKKVTGEPTSIPKEILDMVTPMSPNDMFKAMRQYGIPAGVAVGLITMFGDSVQTYSPRVSQAHKRKLHRGR